MKNKTLLRNVTVVDGQTGEIEFTETREVKMFLFDESKGFLLFNNRPRIHMFPHIDWPDLSNNELAYLLKLSRTMDEHNKLPAGSAKQIAGVIGLSQRRTYDFLFMMNGLRILVKTDNGYYMNPLYFFAGKYLSGELYRLFKEELDPHLSEWARGKLEG